ncbi:MAG: hypothetical protein H7Z42_12645 [Roseiflexaceae bacterium]|nr:hypothetical protein [Roseiflexaceae bacterium]
MPSYIFFFVALGFLLTHEMDAVRRHEWQVFPLLSRLRDDERGYTLFTALHVPLYVLLLWGIFTNGTTINRFFVTGLDIFCIVHVLLHLLLIKHPRYQFNNWFSWTLIVGAGIAGGIDLLFRAATTATG